MNSGTIHWNELTMIMAQGGGRYSEVAMVAQELTKAKALILAVLDGDQGHGFEVVSSMPGFDEKVPTLLRKMADEIEADQKAQSN
jgi:hypothetical protein